MQHAGQQASLLKTEECMRPASKVYWTGIHNLYWKINPLITDNHGLCFSVSTMVKVLAKWPSGQSVFHVFPPTVKMLRFSR